MREKFRDLPLTVEEVRSIMKKEDAKRATWVAVGIGVIAILVGIIIWVAKRREKDLEEHYEYFDDDFDELDDDFEEFDESIYDDGEDKVEYVKINDFMNDEDSAKNQSEAEEVQEESTSAAEEETEADKTQE